MLKTGKQQTKEKCRADFTPTLWLSKQGTFTNRQRWKTWSNKSSLNLIRKLFPSMYEPYRIYGSLLSNIM